MLPLVLTCQKLTYSTQLLLYLSGLTAHFLFSADLSRQPNLPTERTKTVGKRVILRLTECFVSFRHLEEEQYLHRTEIVKLLTHTREEAGVSLKLFLDKRGTRVKPSHPWTRADYP